ncbi:MAG: hypothetical protein KDB53_09795, partial [Planctomycetes bacterium]|nr:hypothetical protein [Planctomycetota bacterium]
MRMLTLILMLLVATQPALVIALGSGCGGDSCVVSSERASQCGGCTGCSDTDAARACCCGSKPIDERSPAPAPTPGQDEVVRALFTLTATDLVGPFTAELESAPGH